MDGFVLSLLIIVVAILLVAVLAMLLQASRSREDVRAAVMAEKLAQLEPVARAVSDIQMGLTELQAQARARQDLERQTAESVRRLETVIAGTQAKGAAGENILEAIFAKLPADWQVRDFRVGNRVVEFGLRLPDRRVLPIDSKWPATNLLEEFLACSDPTQQQRLKAQIEGAVLQKAKETQKYVDPALTANFAIAAVPDAVYDLCAGIQAEVFRLNVSLISYSMFVPYLLLVFQMALDSSRGVDAQKLGVQLEQLQRSVAALQEELEGRFSRAIRMLDNSRSDMRMHLGRISSGLASIQMGAAETAAALPEAAGGDGNPPGDATPEA